MAVHPGSRHAASADATKPASHVMVEPQIEARPNSDATAGATRHQWPDKNGGTDGRGRLCAATRHASEQNLLVERAALSGLPQVSFSHLRPARAAARAAPWAVAYLALRASAAQRSEQNTPESFVVVPVYDFTGK